jgi:hypothetical protein
MSPKTGFDGGNPTAATTEPKIQRRFSKGKSTLGNQEQWHGGTTEVQQRQCPSSNRKKLFSLIASKLEPIA